MPAATRKIRKSTAHIARKYTDLHEGREPDVFIEEKPIKQPKYLVDLGPLPEMMYFKKTPEKSPHLYRHKFAKWAMPTIAHDENGKLHIVDQDRLVVTERGIEDNMARKHSRKSHAIMRANPSHRGARLLRVRRNPLNVETVKKVAVSAGVVGALASATMIGMNMLFQRVSQLGSFTGYKRAGLQAGIGILGSVALQSFGLETLAAGIGIGGVAAGINGAYVTYSTPAAASTTPAGSVYPRIAAPAGAAFDPQSNHCYAAAR